MKPNTLGALFLIVMAMGFTLNEAIGDTGTGSGLKFFDATFEEVWTVCDSSPLLASND